MAHSCRNWIRDWIIRAAIIRSYSLFTKLQRPSVFVLRPSSIDDTPLLRVARQFPPSPIFPTRIHPPFDELLARVRTRTLISWNAFPPSSEPPPPRSIASVQGHRGPRPTRDPRDDASRTRSWVVRGSGWETTESFYRASEYLRGGGGGGATRNGTKKLGSRRKLNGTDVSVKEEAVSFFSYAETLRFD